MKAKRYTASDWGIPNRIATGKTLCIVAFILAAITAVFFSASSLSNAEMAQDSIYILDGGTPIKADRSPLTIEQVMVRDKFNNEASR